MKSYEEQIMGLDLRYECMRHVQQFGVVSGQTNPYVGHSGDGLARLLGYPHYEHLSINHSDRDTRLMRMLLGPNGGTVVKILQARANAVT